MQVVENNQRRTTSTPNGTMTTLASPSLGGASRSLWIVEMLPSIEGPEHAFEDEVIWAITRGSAVLEVDGGEQHLSEGDTVVLPGGVMRRFRTGADGLSAVVTTSAPGTVTVSDGTVVGTPAWVA